MPGKPGRQSQGVRDLLRTAHWRPSFLPLEKAHMQLYTGVTVREFTAAWVGHVSIGKDHSAPAGTAHCCYPLLTHL